MLKNWFYVRSKLQFILAEPPYHRLGEAIGYEDRALHGLFYLMSDHPSLIRWYSDLDHIFIKERTDNPKVFDYWTKQFFIALRGEWDIVIERCERILFDPPTASREKKFILDHKFYLALAKGDIGGMVSIIEELVTPRLISNRASIEGGYTADLICTPALIYSKLAWRNGYEIIVDSSYIPKEWLPIAPLDSYDDPFDFMKKYSVSI